VEIKSAGASRAIAVRGGWQGATAASASAPPRAPGSRATHRCLDHATQGTACLLRVVGTGVPPSLPLRAQCREDEDREQPSLWRASSCAPGGARADDT